jgi:hypothetical protein
MNEAILIVLVLVGCFFAVGIASTVLYHAGKVVLWLFDRIADRLPHA